MKIKTKLKLIFILACFTVVFIVGYNFLLSINSNQNKTSNAISVGSFGWKFPVTKLPLIVLNQSQTAFSSIRYQSDVPQGLPVRLKIPILGVDSLVEDALITPEGRMDVPSGSINVAWFALGPYPGQIGSAVIGGHFGIKNGVPFVFYNLNKLKVGDKIYVLNDKGETLAFVVRLIKSFDRNADATEVFTSDDNLAHLNLITCEGIWNQLNGVYPERRVIFTDAIQLESAIEIENINTFYRPLAIGAEGADVFALQTILEQKGFLKIPMGIDKGFFGALTRDAVTKYQISAGLLANGIFDQITKSKLIL